VRELQDEEVITRATGRPPEHVDLVYVHRPLTELARAVELAKTFGARAVWYQSGLAAPGTKDPRGCWLSPEDSQRARQAVETAGLLYLDNPYIVSAMP
jgi:sugar phosphate isomerase/epimerase